MFVSLPLWQRPRVPLGWDQVSLGWTRTLAGPGPAVRRSRVSRSLYVRPFVKRTVFGTLTGRLESLYCGLNNTAGRWYPPAPAFPGKTSRYPFNCSKPLAPCQTASELLPVIPAGKRAVFCGNLYIYPKLTPKSLTDCPFCYKMKMEKF